MKHSAQTVEFGDFQTPVELAQACCRVIRDEFGDPHTVIEPTCGEGAFLIAAVSQFDCHTIVGYEINQQYRQTARRCLSSIDSQIDWTVAERDFFACDWALEREAREGPVLYLGNPPWVTNSQLGILGGRNLPSKSNRNGVRGIDALTGRSNFDIAESILQTLLAAMRPGTDALAMLVKTSTARKVLSFAWRGERVFADASIRSIDTKRYFDVNVDACLLMLRLTDRSSGTQQCRSAASLTQPADQIAFGYYDGSVVADPAAAAATGRLTVAKGESDQILVWRSGVKHDLSQVVELNSIRGRIESQQGQHVDIEHDLLYPLAKGSDVANGRLDCPQRRILIAQQTLREDTGNLAKSHPRTWRYLNANADRFAARKSSIYRNRDPFALFGIGPYTFAPWKVAICGLYKRLSFKILKPVDDRPVIVDDTCYFLPLQNEQQADFVLQLLSSPAANEFLNARIFWGSKRPITAQVLRLLSLRALAAELNRADEFERLLASVELSQVANTSESQPPAPA